MCEIIDFEKWKRARLGGEVRPPIYRRARTGRREDNGLKPIGQISADILKALLRE